MKDKDHMKDQEWMEQVEHSLNDPLLHPTIRLEKEKEIRKAWRGRLREKKKEEREDQGGEGIYSGIGS